MEVFKTITIEDASKILKMPIPTLRLALQQGLLPFGVAIKCEKEYTYYIFEKRLEKYLEGTLQ